MDFVLTQPVQATADSFREERRLPSVLSKPTDSKVKGLVLERIAQATVVGRAALLPSATAPRIMVDLLAALAVPAIEMARREQPIELMPRTRISKRPLVKRAYGKKAPIGLRRCEPHGWINAWIQFLLSIPTLPELFSFVPRSFEPFREFVDQYAFDQQENRPVSFASGAALVRCLMGSLPNPLFKNVDLYEILKGAFKAMFPHIRAANLSDAIVFHTERHLVWNAGGSTTFDEEMDRIIKMGCPDIFIAIKGSDPASCRVVKRQFVSQPDWHFYDLDAFIEHRHDGKNNAIFVAYLKVDGSWYQCDDERICSLRSSSLSVPLHRGVLLHYKRFAFGKGGWF
jgi:hypothetical protein